MSRRHAAQARRPAVLRVNCPRAVTGVVLAMVFVSAPYAVNSAADTAYSQVIVAGLYLTTQPPDFEHPHGHERIEPFVSLFVAVGIFAAGGSSSGTPGLPC